jgi:diguanylate cyclase (GGDEF)-like protein/PAS domain S-box-containing protein
MRCPDIPADEPERLLALAQYGLSADRTLPTLDTVMEIAVRMFDVPAAAVNMVGATDTFFAASHGIGACDRRRDVSFCAHAINGTDVMVVPDARLDWRFDDNPLVTDGLIIFYAGVPLRAPSGEALGALCVVDNKPRPDLDPAEREGLVRLARLATGELELRRLEVAKGAGEAIFGDRAAQSPDAVVGFDEEARITSWNAAAQRMFGRDTEAMLGRPIAGLVSEADRPALTSVVARVLESAELSGTATGLNAARADGTTFEASFVWVHAADGHGAGYVAVVRDLATLHDERDNLYDLTQFDGLTGLANGRQLREQIEDALLAGGTPVLVLLDLRQFALLNEWQGQQLGDMVLCVVARRLRLALPEGALVARAGGDMFAVLLRDGAQAQMEVARAALAAVTRPMALGRQILRIGCRCGVAIARAGITATGLIDRAEKALVLAKRSNAVDPVSLNDD